jgi:hypothetical protein
MEHAVNAVEMDYLRRSARVSRLEHMSNEEIRRRMAAEESAIERKQKRGLNWSGHVLRMGDERWPQQMYKWKPPPSSSVALQPRSGLVLP